MNLPWQKNTEEDEIRLQRGLGAKELLESVFFREFLVPYIDSQRMQYPDPGKRGWEDKYRMARAKDEVYTEIMNTLLGWKHEGEKLAKEHDEPEKDLNLA